MQKDRLATVVLFGAAAMKGAIDKAADRVKSVLDQVMRPPLVGDTEALVIGIVIFSHRYVLSLRASCPCT